MKVAHINLYFKLPDDFDGDLNLLLEEVLKYRKSVEGSPKKEYDMAFADELEDSTSISKKGYDILMFNRFMRSCEEGLRLFGHINIVEAENNKID
jgi:hypothetical protein